MEEIRRWEEMEMDCLANIFQRLSLEDMAVAVPFVCRSWLQASLDPLCWRALNFRQLNFLPWSSFTRKFTAAYSYSDVSADAASFSSLLKLVVARSKGVVTEIQFPLVFGASLQDLLYASNRACPDPVAVDEDRSARNPNLYPVKLEGSGQATKNRNP
ncbi:F-box/LRR-repeat protein [Canna indica]|uniref:F-box/LRR-repeat protein n=1 Tax=Canna indica TaxID=4628 RepID=A0AAQ3K3R4_9LILI|nr:F-box/LRR-repeat protein [Canna indica]